MSGTYGPSIYRRLLRENFDRLAPELQLFHAIRGHARFRGECRIDTATGAVARILCRLIRLPHAGASGVFEFELMATERRETWVRHFPGRTMRSTLHAADGWLIECIGPVGCWFSLELKDGSLSMKLLRVTILGLVLPRAWSPDIWGREHGADGKLHFDVGIRVPCVGLLSAYRGYLLVQPARQPCG